MVNHLHLLGTWDTLLFESEYSKTNYYVDYSLLQS